MTEFVKLIYGDKVYQLPLVVGSEGEKAVDISNLRQETGLITVSIKEDHSLAGQPVVYLFPKFQPTLVKNLSSSLKQVKPGEYNLTLPALQANEYRIVMEVD